MAQTLESACFFILILCIRGIDALGILFYIVRYQSDLLHQSVCCKFNLKSYYGCGFYDDYFLDRCTLFATDARGVKQYSMDKKQAQKYLGDIIGGSLMTKDSCLIAQLLQQHPTDAEWQSAVVDNNLLQKRSIHSGKRMAFTIKKRLQPMGELFWQQLLTADDELANQLLLIAVVRNSPIVEDFIASVVADALRVFQERLTINDWNDFYELRCRSIPALSQWSDSSIQKIGNNIHKIMAEVGVLQTAKNKKLQRIVILPIAEQWLVQLGKTDLFQCMGNS